MFLLKIILAMENDTCHFPAMTELRDVKVRSRPPVGRPRRGTEAARADNLLSAATRVFLREGYGAASIDRVAGEAGVSTRTIYERYKNKAVLLAAVISRLVDRDMQSGLASAELDRLTLPQALVAIGRVIASRVCDPESAALFRILAQEAQRYPELAAKMRGSAKARVNDAVANYFRRQMQLGTLRLADPDRAAVVFLQMVCAELHERLLFGTAADLAALDFDAHVIHVVDLFLHGALPRHGAAKREP
jgi:AcrR family transcriptional regulator